ncbi:hypothetical protein [Alteromonas ponticola]|uniref:Uncharacterized protein n=1 Tax=Alteromonas ponticola TaxID=2720613 RepID=A0ABX1R1B1_9ALTE|nr:hypothetical protein [Alteromonas ponticola]NMH60255.1 hypothetical protein [Alteromonas ponticola]
MNQQKQELLLLTSNDVNDVTGARALEQPKLSDSSPSVSPIKPPRYFTLAIGEGGGHLPDVY